MVDLLTDYGKFCLLYRNDRNYDNGRSGADVRLPEAQEYRSVADRRFAMNERYGQIR